ncbi:enoyl-CoA hydratase/isomerase family protein [Caproiciproducens sp.]
MYNNLLYSKENAVGMITLNCPSAYNAVNAEMIGELNAVLTEIENDPGVRAVVVTGGTKVFAAGGDIRFMADASPREMEQFIDQCQETTNKISNMSKPFIAAISGLALGGGCELALACDIRIASATAVFGQPEINLGIIPGSGGTQRLQRLVGEGWAKYLIFSGKNIKADTALQIGLVQEVVQADALLDTAKKLAVSLSEKGSFAMGAAKACMNHGRDIDLAAGLAFERKAWALLFCTDDQKEGMHAFLEKRKPEFNGK